MARSDEKADTLDFAGGAVAEQSKNRRLVYVVLTLGGIAFAGLLAHSQQAPANRDLVRWSHNVKGDAKPLILNADDITTWVEGGRRVVLLKGRVYIEQGVVQIHMREGVVWIDEESKKRTGIYHTDIYGDGGVGIEDGPKTAEGNRALINLSTRGEIKLRAYTSKVRQQAQPQDPLYRRAMAVRFPQQPAPSSGGILRTSYEEPLTPPSPGVRAVPVQDTPRPPLPWPPPAPPGNGPETTTPPGMAPPVPPTVPPGPPQPPPIIPPGTPPSVTPPSPPQPPPLLPPAPAPPRPAIPVGPPVPPPPPARPPEGPPRQISIVPRSGTPIHEKSFPLKNGETAVVVTGGIILTIRNLEGKVGLVDIEADRLVFWSRGDSQRLFNNLRSPQGEPSKALEFYLAGNVEIREQTTKENRLLRADEVYYDANRNVAIALNADLETKFPKVVDPVHYRAEEIDQLAPGQFKVLRGDVFASKLPSDPGLKIDVGEATLEEKRVPRTSIFGRTIINRQTGQPEYETQQLFDAKSLVFRLEDVPIFYLPFLKGDANDPLGPLKNINFNYNRIFGFQTFLTLDVYELVGSSKVPGTSWTLDADYLTERGPALGSNFNYAGKNLLDIPNSYAGLVKAYIIDDTGKDILGGTRQGQPHPELRGRFTWQQNVQDLPDGFTVQSQISYLSDMNYLEQYYKREFDQDPNQETFLYVKQQQNNWAWTGLVEPKIRNWVTETEALPRADGYLLGESFFNLFTYNVHGSAGYFQLKPTTEPPPPVQVTEMNTSTGRFDLNQEISLPFYAGPVKVAPYALLDLTYYTEDLTGTDRGRVYGAGGVRASMPLSRLYPDVESLFWNLHGIYHKIVFSGNYFAAKSDTSHFLLPQLDLLDDDATDQERRYIKPLEPSINPAHGLALAFSPLFDPQLYAIRRLVENRIDTLDTIEEFQFDIRQRLQTKRGYPGQEHIIDWMTLDLSGTFFPHSERDNFGENFAFLQYDYDWNIGDRTALTSSGWFDPEPNGPRVFTVGAFLNRTDRTNFYLGFRELFPVNSQAVTAAVTYVFSPKYAITASTVYDFSSTGALANSLILTRIGSDLQVSLGATYNATLNTFGVIFEIVPNLVPPSKRTGLASLGSGGILGR
jgi:hypothetical protein